MKNKQVHLPKPGLSDLKLGAGKRLGRFCLFCGALFPPPKTKPRLQCGAKQCRNAYSNAKAIDYRKDVFQTPLHKER